MIDLRAFRKSSVTNVGGGPLKALSDCLESTSNRTTGHPLSTNEQTKLQSVHTANVERFAGFKSTAKSFP